MMKKHAILTLKLSLVHIIYNELKVNILALNTKLLANSVLKHIYQHYVVNHNSVEIRDDTQLPKLEFMRLGSNYRD